MSNEEILYEIENSKVYAREALIMNLTEDFLVAMEKSGISKAELARLLHKSKSFVTQTLGGSRNMTLRTLSDIAFNLELDVSIVLKSKVEAAKLECDNSKWDKNDKMLISCNAYKRYDCSSAITSNDHSWRLPENVSEAA